LLVAIQVALPASYYLRSDDPDDERFAWRMFSAIRLRRCEVRGWDELAAGTRPIELTSAVHASWQRLLDRGRRPVVEHFLELRCGPERRAAVLERSCTAPSGARLPVDLYRYDCDTARLEVAP
jgi:hypothetical protein